MEHKVLGIIDLDPVNETVSIKLETGALVTDGKRVEVAVYQKFDNLDDSPEWYLPDFNTIGDVCDITHFAEINLPKDD